MVVLIENMNKNTNVVLKPGDLEAIERVIYRNGDDIAVSVGRAFERLEEQMKTIESHIYGRLTEIEKEIKTELITLRLYVEDASEAVIGEM